MRVLLACAKQRDPVRARVARGVAGADDDGGRAVRDETAVEHTQRQCDRLRFRVVLQRDRRPHLRAGMAHGVVAMRHRDRAEHLRRHAEFVHVALRDEAIGRRYGDAERLFPGRMAERRERGDRAVARHAGQPVVAGDAEHVAAIAGLDQRHRLHDHHAGGRAARLQGDAVGRHDAEMFAEHGREHRMRRGEGIGGQQAVDVRAAHARVGERGQRRLALEAERRRTLHLADGGFGDARDRPSARRSCPLRALPSSQDGGRFQAPIPGESKNASAPPPAPHPPDAWQTTARIDIGRCEQQ